MIHKFIAVFVILFSVASCNSSNDGFSKGSSDYNHTRAVGASSNDLLSNNRYSALQIEILYMPGYAPDTQAVEHLKSFCRLHSEKMVVLHSDKEKYLLLHREAYLWKRSDKLRIIIVAYLQQEIQWL